MKKTGAILVLILFTFADCKKKEEPTETSAKSFTFNSLKADQSSIKQGEVTNISADVTGDVTFEWSATSGDVFGSGKVVLFGASTSAGRPVCAITLAIVKVLPEPVTPSKV